MDLDTALYLLKLFVSAFLLCGGVLVSLATWIVVKTYTKTELMEKMLEGEFKKFGLQLASVHSSVKADQHALELRVVKLEAGRGND